MMSQWTTDPKDLGSTPAEVTAGRLKMIMCNVVLFLMALHWTPDPKDLGLNPCECKELVLIED